MGLRSEFGRDHSAGEKKIRNDIQALLRVARAAEEVVEQDKQQFDRLIVVLALEEALEALPEHLKSE